jgi:hypothetical protein
MSKKPLSLFIAGVAFLLVATALTWAAAFNAGVSPGTISSGINDMLVNFSIQNTDGAQNITQVNITLPPGFTYSGGVRQYIGTFSILNNGEILSWVNATGIVYAVSTNYLWFEVDTPAKTGTYYFNVSASDSASALASNNVTIKLSDVITPKWTGNVTNYSSPTYYSPYKNHTFNITWADNVGMDSVLFEWEGTTNYTNTSSPAVLSLGSGKYSITLRDLLVSNYTYRWTANDTNGTENSTQSFSYKVLPHANIVDVYLNGNKNQNITINQATQVNITATGHGTLYIYENGNLLSTGIGPLTTMRTLSVGNYSYKVNASSTFNYTRNVTGIEHGVRAIYPPPKYSVTVSIPTTWYGGARANFTVDWTDQNDPDGFDTAFIELNHTGTRVNYTMNETVGANQSYYSLALTRPMSITWKIYANNSFNSWNATNRTTSVIGKIMPAVMLNITPALNVVKGTRTIAHCYSPHVTVNLYRDGVSVNATEIATLATGSYFYSCNTTGTVNYSAYTISRYLNIVKYLADITWVTTESVVPVEQGKSNTTTIVVKNTGNTTHYIAFEVLGLDPALYSVNGTNVSVEVNGLAAFEVTFDIPGSQDVNDYSGRFHAFTKDRNLTHSFVLRVTPKEETKTAIVNTLALLKVNMTRAWFDINASRAEGYNTSVAESKILQAKDMVDLAQSYIDGGKYFDANLLLDDIDDLIADARTELTAAMQEVPPGKELPILTWVIWAVVIVVVAVLGYLLWPSSGYDTRRKTYRYKSPKQRGADKLQKTKDKIAGKLSKSFGVTKLKPKPSYRYKSPYKPSEQIYKKPAQVLRLPEGMETTDKIAKRPGDVAKAPAKKSGAVERLNEFFDRVTGKKEPKETKKSEVEIKHPKEPEKKK